MQHLIQLRANLVEIYASLQAGELNLYPLSSSAVCYQGSWMGRVIIWFNRVWKAIYSIFIKKEPIQLEQVLEHIIHTVFQQAIHEAYQRRTKLLVYQIKKLEEGQSLSQQERDSQSARYQALLAKEWGRPLPLLQAYLEEFKRLLQTCTWEEEAVGCQRYGLTDFHKATRFFWKLFVKDKYQILRTPLEERIRLQPNGIIENATLYQSLKKEQTYLDLEGLIQQEIPLVALAKMRQPESLTRQEKNQLKDWVRAINQHQEKITSHHFECVLQKVVSIFHIQGRTDYSYGQLLFFLSKEGCELLGKEDAKYMHWRERLRPGAQISCNGKVFTLGEQLSKQKDLDDEFKVFALEGEENAGYVAKFANNRFKLFIEAEKLNDENEHWGVHPVRIIDEIGQDQEGHAIKGLDCSGQCVIQEKLVFPLSSHEWTSSSAAERLTEADERIALVLANHLYCQHQWTASSQILSPAHLLFDREGVLKSVRILKKGEDDYNSWEKFCFEVAKDNKAVLAYLMSVSKLNEHEVGRFYREVVSETLATGQTSLLGRRLPDGYRKTAYQAHVEQLCAEAKQVREACFKRLQAHYRRQSQYTLQHEEILKNLISRRLADYYKASPTPGILSSSLQEQVIASLLRDDVSLLNEQALFPSSQPSRPSANEAYYQEQHALMMRRNLFLIEQRRRT